MISLDELLFRNQVSMRIANQTYVYVVHLLHLILNVMPGVVRNAVFRRLLGKAGKRIFFDYDVYIKYPWLVEMGDDVSVNRGVEFYSEYKNRHKIIIGSNVYIAPHVGFYASGHDLNDLSQISGADIVVEDGVWLGAGVILLPGVRVGRNSIAAAGSILTKDVPSDVIVGGVPARLIRKR